jgi:hypothetical protein
VVEPDREDHEFNPENFGPAISVQRGPGGLWTAPPEGHEDLPEDAVPGVKYPIMRDEDYRRFVVLKDFGTDNEVRYELDPPIRHPEPSSLLPADADDDDDNDW